MLAFFSLFTHKIKKEKKINTIDFFKLNCINIMFYSLKNKNKTIHKRTHKNLNYKQIFAINTTYKRYNNIINK